LNNKGKPSLSNVIFQDLHPGANPLTMGAQFRHPNLRLISLYPLKTKLHIKACLPQNRSNPTPLGTRSCFQCQGFGHIAADCPILKVITLADWETINEEEMRRKMKFIWQKNNRRIRKKLRRELMRGKCLSLEEL